MTKAESSAILLACKKHSIFLTVRNEGDDHLVGFLNTLEIRSFESAKHITNGLVIENRSKKRPAVVPKPDPIPEPRISSYGSSNKKFRGTNDYNWAETRRPQHDQRERDEREKRGNW